MKGHLKAVLAIVSLLGLASVPLGVRGHRNLMKSKAEEDSKSQGVNQGAVANTAYKYTPVRDVSLHGSMYRK